MEPEEEALQSPSEKQPFEETQGEEDQAEIQKSSEYITPMCCEPCINMSDVQALWKKYRDNPELVVEKIQCQAKDLNIEFEDALRDFVRDWGSAYALGDELRQHGYAISLVANKKGGSSEIRIISILRGKTNRPSGRSHVILTEMVS